jgi:asparagine synthase (glutamine-hydrolysing)
MSVQVGIWNMDGKPVDRESLSDIGQELADYGPDGESFHLNGPLGILFRPFHTTFESQREQQPYTSASGKLVIWDGRLDNRDELISQVGAPLRNDSTDLAIFSAAFDSWNTDCFSRLTGDWAATIWDSIDRTLILARDYVGIRHLFYYPRPDRIAWCSHLAGLVSLGKDLTICEEYIAGYFAFYPAAHFTPYQQISSVPPGGYITIKKDGTIRSQTYWALDTSRNTHLGTDLEYEEQYRFLFRKAVQRRLRTDRPVLAGLSGGLDSSSIVCMADDIHTRQGDELSRLDTFSYYDSNEPGEDDFSHFTTVERWRGKKGISVDLKASGDSLPIELPIFSATPGFHTRAEVMSALSSVRRKRDYRVMLSGIGGDEVNGQSLDACVQLADLLAKFRWTEAGRQLMAWSLLMRRPWMHLLLESGLQFVPLSIRARFTDQGKVAPWINRIFAAKHHIAECQMESVPGVWFWRPRIRDAVQTITTLSRRMTDIEPSTIEHRYPFLDKDLVEFLASIPLDQLLRPGQTRSLMRRSLANLLPPEIISRRTKAGAGRCYCTFLEKHWRKIDELYASPYSARLGYVEREQTRAALLGFKNGDVPFYVVRLLRALFLEVWLRDLTARGVVRAPSRLDFFPAANARIQAQE